MVITNAVHQTICQLHGECLYICMYNLDETALGGCQERLLKSHLGIASPNDLSMSGHTHKFDGQRCTHKHVCCFSDTGCGYHLQHRYALANIPGVENASA